MNIARKVIRAFKQKNKTLAIAESCTGGKLADAIVSVSGASKVFLGGLVCYSNSVKKEVLHLSENTLLNVVSKKCALDMAQSTLKIFKSDVAVSVTGYAEKSEQKKIPDGTIFVAFASHEKTFVKKFSLNGTRNRNRQEIVKKILLILLEF